MQNFYKQQIQRPCYAGHASYDILLHSSTLWAHLQGFAAEGLGHAIEAASLLVQGGVLRSYSSKIRDLEFPDKRFRKQPTPKQPTA